MGKDGPLQHPQWTKTSLRDGLCCHLAMHCDQISLAAYIWVPSLTRWLMSRFQLSEFVRSGVLSKAFGAGVVLGKLFAAVPSKNFPCPCQVQAEKAPTRHT